MVKIVKKISFILFLVALIGGCKKDDFKPEESYVKIYNDTDGNKKYYPLGIQQTNDQGYLILSAYNGWNILLMKVDKEGEFLWQKELASNYVSATPNLIKYNDGHYLFCMDDVGLQTYVLKVDENSGETTEIQSFSEIVYPTYAYSDGASVYIQNYDRLSYETGIYKLTPSLDGIENAGSLSIFTSVEDEIVGHITYDGKRLPFLISSTPEKDHLVMSGFYNYSFSLVFLNSNLEFTGVYNGAGFNGGVNAILPLGGSIYSVAKFSYDNQYFNPSVSLDPSAIDITESISASGYSELDNSKPVVIRKIQVGGALYTTMLASTKSNNLVLYFFDGNSNIPVAKKYIGQNTPFTACDVISTIDGGIMILGQVQVMGSYKRIATVKLSNEQMEEIIDGKS